MSTTKQVRSTGPGRGGERPAESSEGPPSPVQAAPVAAAAAARRYRVMFAVPFQTAMRRRRHPPAQQRARHGYAPAPQASRESRQPRRVTSGLLLRPVPRPRRRASGLAIGGSHVGSAGARERSRLAPGRGRRGTAAGSHGPGAVAARDHWAPHDDRRAHRAAVAAPQPLMAAAVSARLTRHHGARTRRRRRASGRCRRRRRRSWRSRPASPAPGPTSDPRSRR
jgi:hypothetical protein